MEPSSPFSSSLWHVEPKDVTGVLDTSERGLTTREAEARLKLHGKNILKENTTPPFITLVWRQIANPLIIMLGVAAVLSFILHKTHEGTFVVAAIVINVALGYWQEHKASSAVQSLGNYLTKRVRVMRDGVPTVIDTTLLVPGDVVIIQSGIQIPADIRLTDVRELLIDESILTGEALPERKTIAALPVETLLGDRTNIAWGGTVVSEGEGRGIVFATGKATALGSIATLVEGEEDEKTPLERSVSRLALSLTYLLIGAGIVIFFLGLRAGFDTTHIFFITIAMIISAIPESLPIAMSVVLALGAENLAKHKGVVRKMAATETLGATSLILTDKTGTLTEAVFSFAGSAFEASDHDHLLAEALMNTEALIDPVTGIATGRPLEVALAKRAESIPVIKTISHSFTLIERRAFNSRDKFSAVVFEENGVRYISLLGAPDVLLHKVGGSEEEKASFRNAIDTYAQTGERILGIIRLPLPRTMAINEAILRNDFSLQGVLRFRDPIRPSVKDAVSRITSSGVRVAVVTGDHPGTASWVAREIGILTSGMGILTGADISKATDEELLTLLPKTAVFARTTPEQKLRLVELFTRLGEVVAVTGDGVNDAPALKRAAIGVAMGSGTDVARDAADLVILDDNFETIVDAIFEGRGVLQKMRTVITYLLADSFDELLLIGGSLIAGLVLPLSALQILFVKFFADIFPAMAFTFEHIDGRRVAHLDRRLTLFDRNVKLYTLVRGVISSTFLFTLYALLIKAGYDEEIVRTFTFASFASYMLFLAFSMRRLSDSIFSYNPFGNRYLTLGVTMGFVMILAALYHPGLNALLGTVPLPLPWFVGVIGVGIANVVFMELLKALSKPQRRLLTK